MSASNTLTIQGLEELRAALRALPADLSLEAGGIVDAAAHDAAADMDAGYAAHEWTGHLRGGLRVATEAGTLRYGARAIVRNRAPHAYWAEHGTQIRRTATGANRGAMPPIHVFIPAAQRHRRIMVQRLIALVGRAGIVVGGGV